MTQTNSEIKILLQNKIFKHPSVSQYNHYSQHVFSRLSKCHTKDIGVHLYKCDNKPCSHVHQQYHSCGNRLLPTKYYHVVFTVPHELHSLFLCNRKVLFDLIFESGHYTLTKLGRDSKWLGATSGIVSILHTNGQDLSFHPHIHCIVTGGGVDKDGKWVEGKRSNGKFLFPRRVMELMYKAYFLKRLRAMLGDGELRIPEDFEAKVIDDV